MKKTISFVFGTAMLSIYIYGWGGFLIAAAFAWVKLAEIFGGGTAANAAAAVIVFPPAAVLGFFLVKLLTWAEWKLELISEGKRRK